MAVDDCARGFEDPNILIPLLSYMTPTERGSSTDSSCDKDDNEIDRIM